MMEASPPHGGCSSAGCGENMVGQDRLTGRRLPVGAAEEEEQFTEPETQSQTDRTANHRPGERCRESCLRPPPRNLTIPAGGRQAGRTCRGFFLIALAGQRPQVSPAKHQSIHNSHGRLQTCTLFCHIAFI